MHAGKFCVKQKKLKYGSNGAPGEEKAARKVRYWRNHIERVGKVVSVDPQNLKMVPWKWMERTRQMSAKETIVKETIRMSRKRRIVKPNEAQHFSFYTL